MILISLHVQGYFVRSKFGLISYHYFFKFHGDHNYDVTPKAIALNIYLKCRKICVIKFRASKNFAVGVPFN